MKLRFGSVCSGIEAASVAWEPLGWEAAWFSEIEPFPCELLAYRFPGVPNYGDMTTLPERIRAGEVEAPDLLCGGTPCQAFSVAGQRRSLDDARGNLSLIFCGIADAIDTTRSFRGLPPVLVFWENVPGVLHTRDNAFGCFLGELCGSGFPLRPSERDGDNKWSSAGVVEGPKRTVAWRVLDAQFFGVPQRRRRVYVVASSRKEFDPAKVLFEPEGLPRDSEESSRARQGIAEGAGSSVVESCIDTVFDLTHEGEARTYEHSAPTVTSRYGTGGNNAPLTLTDNTVFDVVHVGEVRVNVGEVRVNVGIAQTLTAFNGGIPLTFTKEGHPRNPEEGQTYREDDKAKTLNCFTAGSEARAEELVVSPVIANEMAVRRLLPVECERLQGFPDDWTKIPYRGKPEEKCPDSPRYRAIGNSWAVPVVRWIGRRIEDELRRQK